MKKLNLRVACPFHRYENIGVTCQKEFYSTRYFMFCEDCFAQGPLAKTKGGALRKWNYYRKVSMEKNTEISRILFETNKRESSFYFGKWNLFTPERRLKKGVVRWIFEKFLKLV